MKRDAKIVDQLQLRLGESRCYFANMKRRSVRSKVGEVKPQAKKEVCWMTKTMSTSFLSLLPLELVVMVASHLDGVPCPSLLLPSHP